MRRIRRDCSMVNAPRSQKTSTNAASLSFAAVGNHLLAQFGHTHRDPRDTPAGSHVLRAAWAPPSRATRPARLPNASERLHLRVKAQTIAGLCLDRRGAVVPPFRRKLPANVRGRAFLRDDSRTPRRLERMPPPASAIPSYLAPAIRFSKSMRRGCGKDRMGVRVYKPGSTTLPRAIDLFRAARKFVVRDFVDRANRDDRAGDTRTAPSSMIPSSRICGARRGSASPGDRRGSQKLRGVNHRCGETSSFNQGVSFYGCRTTAPSPQTHVGARDDKAINKEGTTRN